MTDKNTHDDDAFFDALIGKTQGEQTVRISPPSAALLELAWETACRYQNNTEEFEVIVLRAASDHTTPVQLTSMGKRWSICWEEIDGNEKELFLQFKCRKEYAETYCGRIVEVKLGDTIVDLGAIDQYGVTERKVESNLATYNPINIRIRPRE